MPKETTKKLLMQANWSEIVSVNFQIDPAILEPRVPQGLELDFHNNETYISLIALRLNYVKMRGFPLPICRGFEGIGLRFYVKRKVGPRYVTGTCLIKDYVSSAIGAWVLSSLFKIKSSKVKLKRESSGFNSPDESVVPQVQYQWSIGDSQNKLKVKGRARMKKTGSDTKVGFILGHNNTYTERDSQAFEHRVERPPWTVWDAAQASFECNTKQMFGQEFVKTLARRPSSVFVSEGSPVTVFRPAVIS
ncbi:DUF2071 domain-containing protein [bacterium]|nr:DUF2071 domain-containing protein [bacterium]